MTRVKAIVNGKIYYGRLASMNWTKRVANIISDNKENLINIAFNNIIVIGQFQD